MTSIRSKAALAAAALLATTAQAQNLPWSSPGSTGIVDEADLGIVEFIGGEGRVKASAPAGASLNLRYPIVALPGFNGLGNYAMRARFLDNGTGARVRLALVRYRLGYAPSTVHTLDSNAFPAAPGYQTRQDCIPINWNFFDSVYYIEATLDKSSASGQAGLAAVQLIPTQCVG